MDPTLLFLDGARIVGLSRLWSFVGQREMKTGQEEIKTCQPLRDQSTFKSG